MCCGLSVVFKITTRRSTIDVRKKSDLSRKNRTTGSPGHVRQISDQPRPGLCPPRTCLQQSARPHIRVSVGDGKSPSETRRCDLADCCKPLTVALCLLIAFAVEALQMIGSDCAQVPPLSQKLSVAPAMSDNEEWCQYALYNEHSHSVLMNIVWLFSMDSRPVL